MSLSRRGAGGVEALQATAQIHHRTTFLGKGGRRQDQVGHLRGGVGEDVAVHVEVELRQLRCSKSGIGDQVFSEREKHLDLTIAHAVADGVE